MPEASVSNPMPPGPGVAPAESAALDARVSALLDEMHQASDRMLRHLGGSPPPPGAPGPPPASGPPVKPPPDELGKAVDQMIADARSAGRGSEKLAALDRELASRADDLIEGAIEEEASLSGPPTAATPAVAPPPVAPPSRPIAPPPIAPLAVAPPPTPSVPSSISAAPVVAAAPAAAPLAPPATPVPAWAAQVRAGLSGRALAALATLSAPLADRPHLRPWIGYLALWTLFNAACLLGYNFFVREPTAPRPPTARSASHTAQGAKDGGHDAKADDAHASEAKADSPARSAKATPKRTRSTVPKKDTHAGGH